MFTRWFLLFCNVFNLFLSYFILTYFQILFPNKGSLCSLIKNSYFKDPYTDFVPPEAQEDSPGHSNPFQVNHCLGSRTRPVGKYNYNPDPTHEYLFNFPKFFLF